MSRRMASRARDVTGRDTATAPAPRSPGRGMAHVNDTTSDPKEV